MKPMAAWRIVWSIVVGAVVGGMGGGFLYLPMSLLFGGDTDGQAIIALLVLVVAGMMAGVGVGGARALAAINHNRAAAGLAMAMGTLLILPVLAWELPDHPERILDWALVLAVGCGLIFYGLRFTRRLPDDVSISASVRSIK
jgi:hypothetical protein